MKKYKTIGLCIIMTVFIVSNIVIGISSNKDVNSNITELIHLNQANAENYGNGKDAMCWSCSSGVMITCYTTSGYCSPTSCGGGWC